MTNTMRGNTAAQDFALGLLASGPMSVSEAIALGGIRLVNALKELTCRRDSRVCYSGGAYRLSLQVVR